MRKSGFIRYGLIIGMVVIIALLAVSATAGAAVDVTAPTVTNVIPADGSTIYTNGTSTTYYQLGNTTPLVIKADYADEVGGSGVDTTSVMVHLDVGNMLMSCPVLTATHVECNAPAADLPPGTHSIDVYVADLAGNLTVKRTYVTVVADTSVPSYANLLPASGSIIYTSQLSSASINDAAALHFDYDIIDAAPSSGVAPMSHVNDSLPPGVMGAMISNTSCTKTPDANYPTHYSCQVNRAKLLHLGDNTLSVLLKDRVGNNNYSDPASVNHYTVIDNVAPVVGSISANATTISAGLSDPLPTNALSTNLASGINPATAMVHVDGVMIMMGCTASATSVSCPTPALAPGTHMIEVMVNDNAGNPAMSSLTVTTGRPSLRLGTPAPRWASYADYTAGVLSVDWTLTNTGTGIAKAVTLTCVGNSNGILVSGPSTLNLGDIAAAGTATSTLRYTGLVSGGFVTVGSWHTTNTGTAQDGLGNLYTYPV